MMSLAAGAKASPQRFRTALQSVHLRQLMRFALAVQIVIAGALVLGDLTHQVRNRHDEPLRVQVMEPIRTGDQHRPYSPRAFPLRPDITEAPEWTRSLDSREGLAFALSHDVRFGQVLVLQGSIGKGDGERFKSLLESLSGELPKHVLLHSPGGLVGEALSIGETLRSHNLNTAVGAEHSCNSACTLILFAGVERNISREAWIGVHQSIFLRDAIMTASDATATIQQLHGHLLEFTHRMGVDPMVQVHALQTPPDTVYFLLPDELRDYRVATALLD